jgi:hypothetical protein
VLEAAASNTDDFLSIDTCFSPKATRPTWNNHSLAPHRKTEVAGSITFNTNLLLTGQQCARCYRF